MARVSRWLTAAILTSLTATSALIAQENASVPPADSLDLVLAGHPSIAASLERISNASALWRGEVEVLRSTGRRAVIVTPQQVLAADPRRGRQRAFDNSVLADISLLPGTTSGIAAVVVVNLRSPRGIARSARIRRSRKVGRSRSHPDPRSLRSRVSVSARGQRVRQVQRSGGWRAGRECLFDSAGKCRASRAWAGAPNRLRPSGLDARPAKPRSAEARSRYPKLGRYGFRAKLQWVGLPLTENLQ